MKNYIWTGIIAVVVALGLSYFLPHSAVKQLAGTVENYPVWFYNGLSAGNTSTSGVSGSKFSVSSTGALTANGVTNTGSEVITGGITAATLSIAFATSSSSPAALGSAASGHFALLVGSNTIFASTTAVTANSDLQISQEATSPIAGITCNTTAATNTLVTVLSGLGANSGFKVVAGSSPATNPDCFSFSITN